MSKSNHQQSPSALSPPDSLRTYPAPWKGQLLLACAKCRKKLKHSGEAPELVSLKRELKKRSKRDEPGTRIRVVNVSCLKMCPKDGLTVCTQQQLGNGACSILRNERDIDALYAECSRQADKSSSAVIISRESVSTAPHQSEYGY